MDSVETAPKSGLQAIGFDHIVLNVSDIDRSKRFYQNVLGFTLYHELARPPLPRAAFLYAGNQGLDLFQEGAVEPGSEMNHMAFRVTAADREEIVAGLAKAGISPEDPATSRRAAHDPNTVYFTDPDGHGIQLLSLIEGVETDRRYQRPPLAE